MDNRFAAVPDNYPGRAELANKYLGSPQLGYTCTIRRSIQITGTGEKYQSMAKVIKRSKIKKRLTIILLLVVLAGAAAAPAIKSYVKSAAKNVDPFSSRS